MSNVDPRNRLKLQLIRLITLQPPIKAKGSHIETMKRHVVTNWVLISLISGGVAVAGANTTIHYSIGEASLQQVIDAAPAGSTVVCDSWYPLTLSTPIIINKPLTLKGLNARLPEGLGKTSLIEVTTENVTLLDLELHGNYNSVEQVNRAPLINISKGEFRIERCWFFDSSKDGVQIQPADGATEDIVGGTIKDIKAYRMGRDAVSISGGIEGRKVRNVTVDNVSQIKGYYRGAVEVSDGTDNITVRNVYAEDCIYAVDVQDHRRKCAANTNVTIENVTAVNCKHVLRTANSPRGHANLTLRNFTAENCEAPVYIKNTEGVSIDGLTILNHQNEKSPPISFENCQSVKINNLKTESLHFADQPVKNIDSTNVRVH